MIWPSLLRYRVPFWPGRGMSVITIRASKRWIEITARTPCKSKDNTFRGGTIFFRPSGKAVPRGGKESLIQHAARIYVDST